MSHSQRKDQQSDEQLTTLICAGKKDFFALLIKRYQEKLYRYVSYLIFNDHYIDDIVQTTFIKAFTKLASFNTKQSFSSWIYRIAHNEAIDFLRHEKKHLQAKIELTVDLASKIDLGKNYEQQEKQELIGKILAKIPDNYKFPLILFFLEERSYREISDILHISESNVGLRINRGKKMFKLIAETEGLEK